MVNYGKKIVENQTDKNTDLIVEELSAQLSSKEKSSVLSMVRQMLMPEVYAYSTDEEEQPYGAIIATMRVVYEKTNTDFRKYIRSSTKLRKKYSDAKITKIVVKCKVRATMARSTPKYKRGEMVEVIDTNKKTWNNPNCGTWYKTPSPTSLYCYRGGYFCGCNNYSTVYWKRNGKSYSHQFNLFHNDSVL